MISGTITLRRGGPRAPSMLYLALFLTLLVLIGILTLTARQPPPPTIAEFAPQAQEQIKDAPDEQSSSSGAEGSGECIGPSCDQGAEGGLGAGTPPVIDVPRARKCIGDPPRQIEDPQAPPCVPYWEGDNGGATWKGVTADEIKITIAFGISDKYMQEQVPRFEAFFNKRFEFYGRKLRIEIFPCGADNPDGMVADAKRVETEFKAFASGHYCDRHFQESVFYDELARNHIMSIDIRPSGRTEEHMQQWHPYQWNYQPAWDGAARNLADWTCKALKGKNADFADPPQQGDPRKFGVTYESRADGFAPDIKILEGYLDECGIDPVVVDTFNNADNAMIKLQTAEVTTVLCVCDAPPSTAATTQGFFPEWIVTTLMTTDGDLVAQLNQPTQQMDQVFGQWWWNKQNLPEDSPWHWALSEDPTFEYQEPPLDYYDSRNIYSALLVLASGIQLAGPELTPENFASGLMKARFPNPGAGGPPYYQGHIGFGPGDHTAQNDAAITWWDENADSTWGSRGGSWCYGQGGLRYGVGRKPWPTDYGGLFQGCH